MRRPSASASRAARVAGALGVWLAACAEPRAFPGPERPREQLASVAGARTPEGSPSEQRVKIESIAIPDGKTIWSGGSDSVLVLPGRYVLRIERRFGDTGIAKRLLEGLPGGAPDADAQDLQIDLDADWSYRIFYDWKAGAFAVLREPGAARPRQYKGIGAPAAAVRCQPEGEPALVWCRFPPARDEACYRTVIEATYRGGYDRVETRVRGRDDAVAARAAHRLGQQRLERRHPELAATAVLEVVELERLASADPCD